MVKSSKSTKVVSRKEVQSIGSITVLNLHFLNFAYLLLQSRKIERKQAKQVKQVKHSNKQVAVTLMSIDVCIV